MCKHDFKCKLGRPDLFKWIGRCFFILVLLCQILVLNQYLVIYENNSSFHAFLLAYIPAMLLWAKGQINGRHREVASGVWFLYTLPLCIHSGWILGTLMTKIDDESPGLDHGFVKYPLSATALVYLLLHAEDYEPHLHMKLDWEIIVDIMDIVNLLDAIIDPQKNAALPSDVHYSICALAIIRLVILTFNFALPVREALSNTNEASKMQEKIFIIYILVHAMLINFPFLIIRLFLHYKFRSGASAFAFKNLLVIVTNFAKVIRYSCWEIEEKPAQVTSNDRHAPSNIEDFASVIPSNPESSRMGDDTSSIASSTRRTQREEQRRSRLLNLQEEDEEDGENEEVDPDEIIVLN